MFESAELHHTVSKQDYAEALVPLREALLDAQYDLARDARFPVVVLVGGVDGAGKGEVVNQLHEWMDPRFIATFALDAPTDEERERPPMWRFWRALPPKGRIGVFLGSWYTSPILRRVYGETGNGRLARSVEEIVHFEHMLAEEGALIVKLWFHLAKAVQRERLAELESSAKTRWRVTDTDWKHFRLYDKFRKVSERVLRETSTAVAPWIVIEGTDPRYRGLTAGRTLLDSLRRRLDGAVASPSPSPAVAAAPPSDGRDVLSTLDLDRRLSEEEYDERFQKYARRLTALTQSSAFAKRGVVMAFEGADAAGKGGAIRRLASILDARRYRVIPIAAPTDEERAQPYLWRFWRQLPRRGRFAIFDRSWYGRVLVERVEGLCTEREYLRAYGEINDFEEQLVAHDVVVLKFWLQISPEEQLARFKEREATGFKRFKITPEDWRNREKWDQYQRAVCDMVDRTSTEIAPWTLVAANDKRFARMEVLRTLVERLESELD